jgi:hypothetical protein
LVRWSGGHLFFFLLQSSHWRFFGPRFIAQVLRLWPEEKIGGRGARRWKGGAEAGAPRRVGRRTAADWRGVPLAPAVPRARGTARKKMASFAGLHGAAGASRWRMGSKKRPSRQWALN